MDLIEKRLQELEAQNAALRAIIAKQTEVLEILGKLIDAGVAHVEAIAADLDIVRGG